LLGLSLAQLQQSETQAAGGRSGRAKNILLLYLYGAVSQLESYDPKPDAPAEIRGPFGTINTSVPGVRICELLPKTAARLNKITLIRSMTQPGAFHNVAMTVTGIRNTSGEMELAPRDPKHWPFFGSALTYVEEAEFKGKQSPLPQNVILPWRQSANSPHQRAGFHSGFLNPRHDPTVIEFHGTADSDSAMAKKDPYLSIQRDAWFGFSAAKFPADVTIDRFQERGKLLEQIDQQRRLWECNPNPEAYDFHQRTARQLCESREVASALDLNRESAATRDAYGWHLFGQATLTARRLIEAGTRIVTVIWDEYKTQNSGWDVHEKLTTRMKNNLCPQFDQTYSTLLDDLEARGLLDDTLVLVLTEHGRTPKAQVSARGEKDGRDHWSGAYNALLAGAGVARGCVLGRSDDQAAYVRDRPVGPKDLLSTIYHLVGHDPHRIIVDPRGRAMQLVDGGQIVSEILRG
jgi:hypothetical protein